MQNPHRTSTIPIDSYFTLCTEEYTQYNSTGSNSSSGTDTKDTTITTVIHGRVQCNSALLEYFTSLQTIKSTNTPSLLSKEDTDLFQQCLDTFPTLGEFRYRIYSKEYCLHYDDDFNNLASAVPHRTDTATYATDATNTNNHTSSTTVNGTPSFMYGSIIERLYNNITEEYNRMDQYRLERIVQNLHDADSTDRQNRNRYVNTPSTSNSSSTTITTSTKSLPSFKGLIVKALAMYFRHIVSSLSSFPVDYRSTTFTKILLLVQGSGRRTDEVSNATLRLMEYYTTVLGAEEIWPEYRSNYLPLRYVAHPRITTTTTTTGTCTSGKENTSIDNENDNDTLSETVPMTTTIERVLELHHL